MPTNCPPIQSLELMLSESLDPGEMGTIEDHVGGCDACQAVLEALTRSPGFQGAWEWRSQEETRVRPHPTPSGAGSGSVFEGEPTRPDTTGFRAELGEGTTLGGGGGGRPGPHPEVPGYEIVGELGRGGMGIVYLAREARLNRMVALKMVLQGGLARTETIARLRVEAEMVARLQHPNVVRIHAIGEFAGLPYIDMEFVRGGNLAERLRGMPAAPREAAEVVAQLADGVEAMHRLGIIHRDLKPGNVLVDADGTPKIGDFGLAKALYGDSDLTRTDSIMGSPSYMAPEQAGGASADVGAPADIYSLGVILYEMLTGRPPFRGASPLDTLAMVRSASPVPPRRLVPGISRDLETITLKCLERAPERRYAAADLLARDLGRYLRQEPIQARRIGAAEKVWRWSRRNRVVASLLATLALVLAGGIAAITVLWARAANDAASARISALRAQRNAIAESRAREAGELQSARLELETGDSWGRQRKVTRALPWIRRAIEHLPAGNDTLRRAAQADLAAWAGSAVQPTLLMGPDLHYRNATLSPDGRTLFVAHSMVTLIDLDTGRRRSRSWKGVPGPHIDGRFGPDGRWMILTSESAGLSRWDLDPDVPPVLLMPGAGRSVCGGISSDGTRVLAFEFKGGSGASLISPANGRPAGPAIIALGQWISYSLSPDGSRALSRRGDGEVRLWDADAGRMIGKPSSNGTSVELNFSPGGDTFLVAFGSGDAGGVRACNAADGSLRVEIPTPDRVVGMVYRPDGRSALICQNSGTAWLHDLASGREIGQPIRSEVPFVELIHRTASGFAISPDGEVAATSHIDNSVRLWDLATGRPLGPILEHGSKIDRVYFLPDGLGLLTALESGEVRRWDLAPAFSGRAVRARHAEVAALSPDGRRLALADDGVIRILDTWTGLPLAPPLMHDQAIPGTDAAPLLDLPRVRALAFSPDGGILGTAGYDGKTCLWDVATGKRLREFPNYHWGMTLAFSPDGKFLATGGVGDEVRLWDVATGRLAAPPLKSGRVSQDEIHGLAFRDDGRVLVAESAREGPVFWDLQAGFREILIPSTRPAELVREGFLPSPDGRMLLTWAKEESQLWDLREPGRAAPGFGPIGGVAAFSPDGRRVATASGDTQVLLWDVASRAQVAGPLEHPAPLTAIGFSPDGRSLVTGAGDGSVRTWDVATGHPIGPALDHGESVARILLPRDGRSILAVGGHVTRWPLPQAPGVGTGPAAGPARLVDLRDRLAARNEVEGRFDAALWHLDRLAALQPGEWSVFARRSAVHRSLGHPDRADADAARAESLAPRDLWAAWRAGADLAEVQAAIGQGRMQDALAPVDRLTRACPDLVPLRRRSFRLHVLLGAWSAAEGDIRALLSSGSGVDLVTISRINPGLLGSGDQAGYERLRDTVWSRPGPPDPDAFNLFAWLGALGPARSGVPPAILDRLQAEASKPDVKPDLLNTQGAILLRAGQHARAIEALQRGIALNGGESSPHDWAFLALAHARLGHAEEARRWAARLAGWQPGGDPAGAVGDQEIRLLRDEVFALVGDDRGFPADPFAP